MNRLIVVPFVVAALGVSSALGQQPAAPAAPAAAAPAAAVVKGPVTNTLKADWQRIRDMVVNISDIVPEDKYDFKATPEVRSFRDLILHLAGEGYTFLRPLAEVQGITLPNTQALTALKTRDEVMKALRDSYEFQAKVIDGLSEAQANEMVAGRGGAMAPRWNAIVNLFIDNMDHYGNLVTYVRLNGMVPPTTAARAAGRGAGGGGRGGAPGGAPAGEAPRGN